MRKIQITARFKRDYKREMRGVHRAWLDTELSAVVTALVHDQALEQRYCDHALGGAWQDHRDCHIRPDLVLIYRKPASDILQLVRLGSHSKLGF